MRDSKNLDMLEKIVNETIDTTVDSINEKVVDYMYEYGDYEESDNRFIHDKELITRLVIKQLYFRTIKNKK